MRLRAVCALALLPAAAVADSVFFVDNAKGTFLRSQELVKELTAKGNAAATAALAGISAPFHIDHSVSSEVNNVVSPNVFDRPEAVLSVQVESVDEGNFAKLDFPFASLRAPLREAGAAVTNALSELTSAQIQSCEAECDSACMKGALGEVPEGLDATEPSVHHFLVELACFARSVGGMGAEAKGLVMARLSGYRELVESHPAPAVLAEAKELLAKTIAAAVQRFHDVHGGKAAAQVVILTEAEEHMAVHQAARMLIKGDKNENKVVQRDLQKWYAKVAAYGVGIIMAATTAAGIICLCSMPTGQDSLLYVRQKED